MYRLGSLFSGIGGFELGFEWTGEFKTVWQVEIDPFARRVLAKHWPDVTRFEDVRTVGAHNLEPVDILIGGFPCQDISNAGLKAGLSGERSGLWFEFARIIGEIRPRIIVLENVAALLIRGLSRVLADLAALGYDAEWSIVSACSLGAPHTRERVFIVAYPNSVGRVLGGIGGNGSKVSRGQNPSVWSSDNPESQRFAQIPNRHAPLDAVFRVADGVSRGLDSGKREKAIGNAVSPVVSEFVARLVLESGLLGGEINAVV
jgi:DNA (cytosine-5)-methyltransferase 1